MLNLQQLVPCHDTLVFSQAAESSELSDTTSGMTPAPELDHRGVKKRTKAHVRGEGGPLT